MEACGDCTAGAARDGGQRFFDVIAVLPFDRACALIYGELPFVRHRFDRLIAAHALALDLRSSRQIARFPGHPAATRGGLDPVTFRAIRSDALPGHVSRPARRESGGAGARAGYLEPRRNEHPRFRDGQASQRRRYARGRRRGDGASTGRARRCDRQRRRWAPDAGADAARRSADAGASPRARGRRRRHLAFRPVRGFRRANLRRAAARTGVDRRLCPLRRRAWRDGHPRCLREAASRGNGRGLQRRGGELRARSPGISALYPACYMGRAHDPRSAAVGGSCEDRGVATRTRGRRHTATAAGPDRAPRGRIAGTALWRAATRYEG